MTIRVTIWNEGRHEKTDPPVAAIYPDRIDGAIAVGLKDRDFAIERGTIDDPEQGLPQTCSTAPTSCSGGGMSRMTRCVTR